MQQFSIALFEDAQTALAAHDALVAAGFAEEAIGLVTPRDASAAYGDLQEMAEDATEAPTDAARGAMAGTAAGGALAALAAAAWTAAVPGVGPVLGVGAFLYGIVGGAVAGGFIGALASMGVPSEEADTWVRAIRSGAVLVVVHVERPGDRERAEAILEASGPVTAEAAARREEREPGVVPDTKFEGGSLNV